MLVSEEICYEKIPLSSNHFICQTEVSMVKYKLNQTSLGDVPFCALLVSKFVIYRRKHQVEFLHLSKVSVQKKGNF